MLESTPGYQTKDIPGQLPPDRLPDDVDLEEVAKHAVESFKDLKHGVLTEDALWRDWMSLSGQNRTFCGSEEVIKTWTKAISRKHVNDAEVRSKRVLRPCPGSAWVSVTIAYNTAQENGLKGFHTANVGLISESGTWKIWMMVTILESFEGHGHPDEPQMAPSAEPALLPNGLDYSVAIVGGGQGGLSLAGRLKALNIPAIVIEKGPAVGNAWTSKYDSVKQHTLREYNNLPFGRTWNTDDPDLLPGKVVAHGFTKYTEKYGINVWLNSEVTSCSRNDAANTWMLEVTTKGASSDSSQTRTIRTKHLAIATGAGVGAPSMPNIPNTDQFKGTYIHQSSFRNAKNLSNKHAVIIGTGTSAHDIAQDCFDNNMHVTMIQRNPTAIYPIEWVLETQKYLWNLDMDTGLADRMGGTAPVKIGCEIIKRNMQEAAKQPKYVKLFEDLEKHGFRVDRESGMLDQIWQRYGGYYIDVGTSKHIANGDIKVKSGVAIKSLTENGIIFEDGEEIPADLIVAATGYEPDYRKQVAQIVGEEMASELPEYWGLTKNGDVRGFMQENRPGLWMIGGTAPQARWTSRFVAMAMMLDLLGIDNVVR
ncbi:hypothetical protein PMZ80_002388 [Knufia obscura]|uniref:Flavin-containing monooxygenase n=1 Tax=Knufia obscura TaxID=1635080 RepID=A0ABR0RY42_9EURO|nr:hypothetical protein PMZ80_002388 [Knufia obscura]